MATSMTTEQLGAAMASRQPGGTQAASGPGFDALTIIAGSGQGWSVRISSDDALGIRPVITAFR